ncbi:MAG: hypothetical protein A2W93_09170 [Bacteroidetes bacterium GWF2_43_63]|nr:MAG: hypothetical protein A2W94_05550 [Bacteroidetes bacterium GWE2_42_42]OFY54467.1 MAG: hypothetical protein A2W93_09170 [Bacteroidetes bacterium GWF2_43_63]HBG70415.1 [Fe-S]-binding protein [Bacteroidales bacterium]HCB63468.1 [Fe-S]-binding protein [Bacteroidales bacterium]
MSSSGFSIFRNSISEKLSDTVLQQAMKKNTENYEQKFGDGIAQFNDFEGCRERLSYLKKRALNNLDKYLLEFESKFIRNGGTVYWADTVDDVARILAEILPENRGVIVKSKSMTGEEIGFDNVAKERGDEVVETDLGEFIVQQMGQKPSHITAPAIHLSKVQIAEFFNTRFGSDKNASAEEITDFVRKLLRTKFTESSVGVTGANFIIADTGSVAITENEGNASLATSWPRKHIVIAGIEKVIPSVRDLYLFWPMLASHATGQKISVYNHIISGPARSAELDGPGEMAVILVNNKRHVLLEDLFLRESLQCIRCGACLTVCPVFCKLSGHAWPSVYSGPIGSVIHPHIGDEANNFHLSFASTLCGKCTQRCPVKIPVHNLLVYNRHLAVERKLIPAAEGRLMRMIVKRLKSRKSMDLWSAKIKGLVFRIILRKSWMRHKAPLQFAEKSFNTLMTEKKKGSS